jgi:hypothetical protein
MKYHYDIYAFIIVVLLMTTGCAVKSSLINAASKGDTLTTQKQIKEGANINEVDKNGATPLMHAIWNGQTETAKALVNMGADLNVIICGQSWIL